MSKLSPNTKVWIHTYNGHEIDLVNPRVADVDAIDIAHALSWLYRFTGHAITGWSVGQHSVVGSILAEVIYPEIKWLPHGFLLHDASEAYLGDISSPLKSLLPGYTELEEKHRKAIEGQFAVSLGSHHEKVVDLRMLATERYLFMPEGGTPWTLPYPKFEFEEWMEKASAMGVPGNLTSAWDFMWTPWPPEYTEEAFLTRMEKLGL